MKGIDHTNAWNNLTSKNKLNGGVCIQMCEIFAGYFLTIVPILRCTSPHNEAKEKFLPKIRFKKIVYEAYPFTGNGN